MDVLNTSEEKIRNLFQGKGARFTGFCDALIRSHAAALGVPDSELETTGAVNDPDGGVDTRVRSPMTADPSGWFREKTAWQYKGQSFENVDKNFPKLLEGKFLQECIEEGFAYRLAVADSLTSEQRSRWEKRLQKRLEELNPSAPPPRVVTAADLSELANRYPAFVLVNFHPDVSSNAALHLSAWKRTCAKTTPHFVEIPAWESVRARLRRHANFGVAVASAVLTVQGEAGVGKTRLTYETLSAVPGATALVLYCDDVSDALGLIRYIAKQRDMRAIIVADECGPAERLRLMRLSEGSSERIRVIAIDNSQVSTGERNPELSLSSMSVESLIEVLAANFPDVPDERRARYADLAKGFPRFAADLCRNDKAVAPHGHLGPAAGSVAEYLDGSLAQEEWRALKALALVTKLGFTGDVRDELSALCDMLRLDRNKVEEHLQKIRRGPGFVVRAGRYFYASPEIVAVAAFHAAWDLWAKDEREAFLQIVPQQLLSSFLNRVKKSASEEVRRFCAAYFRSWTHSLDVHQLRGLATTRRFVDLVETSPVDYLPALRRLVEESSCDALLAITGESIGGEWGPRRALVWLMEALVQFPEYFSDAERILLRLALAESEPEIANNATAIWCQVFRVYLSGTATPFSERFARLQGHGRGSDSAVRELVLRAVDRALSRFATRTVGPTTVAGRIPPREWSPQSQDEQLVAYRSMVELLGEVMRTDVSLRPKAAKILIQHSRRLLGFQLLREARAAFASIQLLDAERAELLEEIDSYLRYDAGGEESDEEGEAGTMPSSSEDMDGARQWRAELAGTSLHDRLVVLVGRQGFSTARYADEVGWQQRLDAVATELLAHPTVLKAELPWLLGGSVSAAGELGAYLGRRDAKASVFEALLTAALPGPHRALARGYLFGLMSEHPAHSQMLNEWLDARESSDPEAVAEFALSAGPPAHALKRVLRLYDVGRLPVGYLHERNFAVREPIGSEEFSQLLQRLAVAAESGDVTAVRVGLDSLAMRVPYNADKEMSTLLAEHPDIVKHTWSLLDAGTRLESASLDYWDRIALHLGRLDPLRATRFTCSMLFENPALYRDEGVRVLKDIASHAPEKAMQALGESILDTNRSVAFYVGRHRPLFEAIPMDVVTRWLEKHGVEAARKVARHLPVPYLNGTQPVVPPLTAWVLSTFEEDDRTFREFCLGVHSFQWYHGDIAAQHEAEAEVARRFLDHPLRRIREWAAYEESNARSQAARWRQREEEDFLPE
ncbi:MAG TPA: hypothetical protein VK539_10370 [Myxococcaceae bacterium]|nr:hypothetical protein [Myxococcaceae bacterium]